MDGTGKTSCARSLQAELIARGFRCRYLHYPFTVFGIFKSAFRHVTTETIFSGNGNDSRGVALRGVAPIALSFIDGLFGRLSSIDNRDEEVVICDRYLYDHAVNWLFGWPEWITKLFMILVQRPSIVVHLDISPQVAAARRPESGSKFYSEARQKYWRVFIRVPSRKVSINSEGPKETTMSLLLQCLDRFNFSEILRGPSSN